MSQYAQLDAVYASLPTIACQHKCVKACGVTPMSVLEHDRLSAASLQTPGFDAHRSCRYLKPTGCNVYKLRPLICRLYGLVPSLKCEFGCVPDRWLTDEEGHAFIALVNELGGGAVMPAQVPA